MADGPRCKRRKQANPRRTSVSNYSAVVEGSSDSDDEDKLHIAEEEGSIPDCDSVAPDDDPNATADAEDGWDEVREECVSDGDDDGSRDALVEEILQSGDTAVIFPEAPEDEPQQGTPENSGHDENGTADAFSQLLTCPYCSRGYKRYTSLKEHVKLRHEKSDDNFSCSVCSYTFSHRLQLDRHMSAHKSGRDQRHVAPFGGNRKFKCTECGKAFKYKHHLKEHLRIHSGEKPYECSNCKKRFSHSGSYSSHISSKKCIGLVSVNGRHRPPSTSSQGGKSLSCPSPMPASKLDHGKPLHEQLPITQIKSEPMDYECKPVVMAAAPSPVGMNGVFQGGAAVSPLQGAVQAVVLPTVGLVSPISINVADLQNVLKLAVDGSGIRQVLVTGQAKGGVATSQNSQQQQVIQAFSLPIVDHDGSAKIIINYSLDSSQIHRQPGLQLKKEVASPGGKAERQPEDLTMKNGQDGDVAHATKDKTKVNGTLGDNPDPLALKNLLSLLKAYFALNAEPTSSELSKIAESVNLPAAVVRKWFEKMQSGQISVSESLSSPGQDDACPAESKQDPATLPQAAGEQNGHLDSDGAQEGPGSPREPAPAGVNGVNSAPGSPGPLNLSADGPVPSHTFDGEGPLDLSLPKLPAAPVTGGGGATSVYIEQDEPLNLTCLKREVLSNATVNGSPISIVTTPLQTIVAITDQGQGQCLAALGGSKTILIPQLTYTYTPSTSLAGTPSVLTESPQNCGQEAAGLKEETTDVPADAMSVLEEQNDSDSGTPRKKMRKTEAGLYACDLCDKIFQKSSSLLRHKYEHTGKRPHECGICNKAFKHKHHLIEHTRLHSGEKPYQCDKCGKRFSHSGSYSQHMNHRYSYCKKEAQGQALGQGPDDEDSTGEGPAQAGSRATTPPSQLDSDERASSTREDGEESEGEDSVLDEDEIQVVQIGEEGGEDDDDDDAEEDEGGDAEGDGEMVKVVVMEEGEEQGAEEEQMDTDRGEEAE
uniref:Zinc finger E-box-binding homeobox 1 n=1 Tax=Denticeps clupeoides TaxID=299321 RepID=A0AAY4A6M0_9TELE